MFIKLFTSSCALWLCFTIVGPPALAITASAGDASEGDASEEGIEFFENRIRPVLVEHCYKCHSEQSDNVKGGLLLDSQLGIRNGGDSGAAVVPGNLGESLLLDAIRYESFEMPPDGKLPEQVVADFVTWIGNGAPDPREGGEPIPDSNEIDFIAAQEFWAFRPPSKHARPELQNIGWVRMPIDAFVLSRLEAAGVAPNPEADRVTWLRRVTLDLIGLPPSPEEVDAFLQDTSPSAHRSVVDRLLASPRYGERWARVWLDVARYAEDQAHIVGKNSSLFYPNAYLYRDWVIDQLNEDLPYDDFLKLQLSADLMAPEESDNHVALGFLGLGPKYYRRNSPEVMADEWEDRVDTVARGLLGLTVACARCHDHKYDPISTQDYYALAGVFASTEMFNRPLDDDRPKDTNGQAKKPVDSIHIVRDQSPQDLNVFIRGDVTNKGPVVERRFLQVLRRVHDQPFTSGSGRLELADAIATARNPLTARVLVNRVWGLHFGRAVVETPSNFGSLGERPSHPLLLDDLAVRFMESGWSIKWLQREILLSATYRQSSDLSPQKKAADPANRLLSRMSRRRLSVEAWRDSVLAHTGKLESSIGGTSIDPADPKQRRRTVYSKVSRLDLDPMLALFDFPDPNAHSARRGETTTPLQKLFVMNSPFMVEQAEALSQRLVAEGGESDESRVRYAYHLLFAREPTAAEAALALEYLAAVDDGWSRYAQVLLASNEMLIVD